MNRAEAKSLLLRRLVAERRRPYGEHAARLGDSGSEPITGPSGTEYQFEIVLDWDSRPNGDIRVLGSIDDGGWRACCPLSYGFLVKKDD